MGLKALLEAALWEMLGTSCPASAWKGLAVGNVGAAIWIPTCKDISPLNFPYKFRVFEPFLKIKVCPSKPGLFHCNGVLLKACFPHPHIGVPWGTRLPGGEAEGKCSPKGLFTRLDTR